MADSDIPPGFRHPSGPPAASESAETLLGDIHDPAAGSTFRFKTLDRLCADHVREALTLFRWNMSRAAPALGVDRRTLYRMCQRWGIARPERHPHARKAPASLIPSEEEQGAFDAPQEDETDEGDRLVPGTYRETVLASGSAQPGGLIRDVLLPAEQSGSAETLLPGPGLGDFSREFGPDNAETTRAVLRVGEYRYPVTDLVMTTAAEAPIREQFGALDLPGLPELPKAPIAVSADSLVEFEELSHIPTLEIDE